MTTVSQKLLPKNFRSHHNIPTKDEWLGDASKEVFVGVLLSISDIIDETIRLWYDESKK